jgi:hypothetical protein
MPEPSPRLGKRSRFGARLIQNRIGQLLRRRGYATEPHISTLFGGFDSMTLLKANARSHDQILDAVCSIAIEYAKRREKKLGTPSNPILGTDLIPALNFDKIKKQKKSLQRLRAIFSKSCPWCD